jgi:hypothetical protein
MNRNELIEKLSEQVHDAWMKEKLDQGFHCPMDFTIHPNTSRNTMFVKRCDKCHTDMYPYNELPENIKEYDRVTVITVLNALENILGYSIESVEE